MQSHKAKYTLKEEKQLCKFYIISLETKKDRLNKKKHRRADTCDANLMEKQWF